MKPSVNADVKNAKESKILLLLLLLLIMIIIIIIVVIIKEVGDPRKKNKYLNVFSLSFIFPYMVS